MNRKEPASSEELKRYFAGIEVRKIAVTSIKTPPFLPLIAEILLKILDAHGITVEQTSEFYLMTFPIGTYKTEILPRTQDERSTIFLPDSFELREVRRRGEEYSFLQIDIKKLEPDQQKALEKQ